MDNAIHVSGNLVRDFELRYSTAGKAIGSAGVAVNRRYQVNGEWQEEAAFFNIVAFGQLAENAAASLTKGARVVVTGRLSQRSWDDKDGNKRSVVEIVADDIGPSLKWAQAQVERNERSTSSGGGGSTGGRANPYPDDEPFVTPAGERDL